MTVCRDSTMVLTGRLACSTQTSARSLIEENSAGHCPHGSVASLQRNPHPSANSGLRKVVIASPKSCAVSTQIRERTVSPPPMSLSIGRHLEWTSHFTSDHGCEGLIIPKRRHCLEQVGAVSDLMSAIDMELCACMGWPSSGVSS